LPVAARVPLTERKMLFWRDFCRRGKRLLRLAGMP
jgi:hypothetical protein